MSSLHSPTQKQKMERKWERQGQEEILRPSGKGCWAVKWWAGTRKNSGTITNSKRIPASSHAWNAGCEDVWTSEAQRSALERRSVVSGSCWIVWCNIKASNPARFVMAVRTLRSCSNSSSSLYHCQGRRAMRRSSGRPTSPWPHPASKPTTRTRSRSTSARRNFSQQ